MINYRKNVYSQCGQDGIIKEICCRLDIHNGYVVEFGAWDGQHLSNSRNLILHHGWGGLLIEPDRSRYNQLVELYKNDDKVLCMEGFISPHEGDLKSFDVIMHTVNAPDDIDFVSIDVDSCDWHILNSINEYKPKIVCIETSVSIPFFVDFVAKPDNTKHPISSSPLAMYRLLKEKGYIPVCYCGHDWIAIRKDQFDIYFTDKEQSYLEMYCDGIEYQDSLVLPTESGQGIEMCNFVSDKIGDIFLPTASRLNCAISPKDLRGLFNA